MEENVQHFWHIMLYYFKEGTNATEMQKEMFLQFMEKGPWLIECVKKWSEKFVLEISLWTTLHSQVDQLKLIAIR